MVPLKVTVPEDVPKLDPSMVTLASTSPESGSSREMTGAGRVTVKVTPALDCPPEVLTHHGSGGGPRRHACLNLIAVPTGGGGGGSIEGDGSRG